MPNYASRYDSARLKLLGGLIPDGNGATAVDIGCNDGTICQLIANRGYRPIGFDLAPGMVGAAKQKHPDLEFRTGSIIDSKGIGRSLTTCLEVIEHIPPANQADFVSELADTVPSGGLLLLSTPGRHSLLSYLERARQRKWASYTWWDPTHVGVLSWRRLRRLLQPAFQVESLIGFCYLPTGRVHPFPVSRRPLSAAGFDLIVTARRRQGTCPDPVTNTNHEAVIDRLPSKVLAWLTNFI